MKIPKSFVPEKNLDEKVGELLNSEPKNVKDEEIKKLVEAFSLAYKDTVKSFDDLYFNKKVCKSGSKEDMKKAAETAYALAMLAKRSDENEVMQYYARKSIEIYKTLNVETLADACPYYRNIGGVEIPDLMHDGIVIYEFFAKDMNWL